MTTSLPRPSGDAGGSNIQLVAVGLAAYGIEQDLSANDLAAFEFGENLIAVVVDADGNDFFSQAEDGAKLAQLKAEALDDFAVDEIKERGALVEQC